MALAITERAAAEVKNFFKEQEYDETNALLRVGIISGGCSGLNYSLNIETEVDAEKDKVTEHHGVRVVVDRKSALSLKVPELVDNHTEFTGNMLYTVTFVLAMNKDKYAALPDDLKAAFDSNSGLAFSVFAGGTMAEYDGPARDIAVERGNNIVTLSAEESARWADVAAPVYDQWLAEMADRGIDGQALIDQARALMADFDG